MWFPSSSFLLSAQGLIKHRCSLICFDLSCCLPCYLPHPCLCPPHSLSLNYTIYLEAVNAFSYAFTIFVFVPIRCHKIRTSSLALPPRAVTVKIDRQQLRTFGPDVDHLRGRGSGVAQGLRTSLDNNDDSLRTPWSIMGSVHRIPVGLQTRFLGRRLGIHFPIGRSIHYHATHRVGYACKSISPHPSSRQS